MFTSADHQSVVLKGTNRQRNRLVYLPMGKGLKFWFWNKLYYIWRHWTPLLHVKDQYSHLVYPNICLKCQICENLDSIGHRSWRIMKGKTPLLHIEERTRELSTRMHFWECLHDKPTCNIISGCEPIYTVLQICCYISLYPSTKWPISFTV